ncbi:MAG: hypothetical protein GX053_12755 [Tissierella sp.]|nr:hypothetical protein [Tissierella sp.]
MITIFQKEHIENLYKDLGQEVEIDLESLTKEEAHETIQELLELRNGVNFK